MEIEKNTHSKRNESSIKLCVLKTCKATLKVKNEQKKTCQKTLKKIKLGIEATRYCAMGEFLEELLHVGSSGGFVADPM